MMGLNKIHPASGAIIMALGIFLNTTIEAFPFLYQVLGEVFTVLLSGVSIVIYTVLVRQLFHKDFPILFLNNPVHSFMMGTWIAGVSILSKVLIKYFPEISSIVHVMMTFNTLFWILFSIGCFYKFIQLWKEPLRYSIDGVVLLSTVATQSLVIIWVKMFPTLPGGLIMFVVLLGLLFYLCGILLIGMRYKRLQQWSLSEDWTNSNCIIHGALSISGLAIVASNILSPELILYFWLFVFVVLIIVEALEVMRAILRIQHHGWKKGLFTYNTSQWSRNFTFGMFYAFTFLFHQNSSHMKAIYAFHEGFLVLWAWLVLGILIIEIGLWGSSMWSGARIGKKVGA